MTCAEAAEAGAHEPVLIGCGPGALARRGKGSQRLQWAEVPWRRREGTDDARALTPRAPAKFRSAVGASGQAPSTSHFYLVADPCSAQRAE